jgi:serine/threonine protein kinase
MVMSTLPKSPNLIGLIGYCEMPYMAILMKEYPMSLRDFITNTSTAANESQWTKVPFMVAKDIANGMNLIHQKGIIHFDLKPANVLVELQQGQQATFVVCDFGFANFVGDVQDKIIKGVKQPSAMICST